MDILSKENLLIDFTWNGIQQDEGAIRNAVGDNSNLCLKNIFDVLDQLPSGFIGVPWFQLKTMLNLRFEQNDKITLKNMTKAKAKKQDKTFLSEISKEKHYLEVRCTSKYLDNIQCC